MHAANKGIFCMDTTKHIKSLTKAYIVAFIYRIFEIKYGKMLPALLTEYNDQLASPSVTGMLLFIGAALLLVFIGSLYGLLTERTWAKHLFIYASLGMILFELSIVPSNMNENISVGSNTVLLLVTGAIIGLLLYTPSVFSPAPISAEERVA